MCNQTNSNVENSNSPVKEVNLKNLFTEFEYQIPLYQRSFAWSDNEVKQLLVDLHNHFFKENNENYFLGSFIVNVTNNKYEIIDGQQRVTVLFLLLLILGLDIKEHYPKFEARQTSENTFKYLITLNGEKATDSDNFDTNIINAYNLIIDFSNHKEYKESFSRLKDKLESIVLYIITVPQNTDLHRYFETMNNRGMQLSQTDLIKEKFLSYFADKENETNEDNNFYRSIFSEIWNACFDMNHYFQKNLEAKSDNRKYTQVKNPETGISAREVVFGKDWDSPQEFISYNVSSAKSDNRNNNDIFEIINNYTQSSEEQESDRELFVDEGNVEVKIKFKSIIKFDIFLLYVLKFWCEEKNDKDIEISFNEKKLIKTFDDKFFNEIKNKPVEEKQVDIKKFFLFLIKLRFLFDNYIIKREVDDRSTQIEEEKWCIKKLTKKNSIFQIKNAFDDKNDNDNLIKIQSCLHVSYQIASNNDWLYTCLEWLYKNKTNINIDDFIKVNEKYACDKILVYKNNNKESAYKNGTSTAHIVFNYLDYLIYKNYKNKKSDGSRSLGLDDCQLNKIDFKNFFFSTSRSSVEHWYPQNPGQDTNLEKINVIAKLNDFGNLALVTTSINSRNGNRQPLSKKKDLESFNQNGNFSLKLQIMMALTNEDCCWMSNDNNDKNQMYCCHSKNMQDILSTALKEMSNTKDKH